MKAFFVLYFLVTHIFIVAVFLKTDILHRIQLKLGFEVSVSEFSSHYYAMHEYYKRVDENVLSGSAVFIGDSIIQGLSVSSVLPLAVNFGVGMDTTLGVIKRLPDYSSINNAKVVIISVGLNDLRRRDNEHIIKNLSKINELIPYKIPVVFNAILPIDEVKTNFLGYNARIRKINKRLSVICDGKANMYCVNIMMDVVDDIGNLSSVYHLGDGIHLNKLGNDILINNVKIVLQDIINKT